MACQSKLKVHRKKFQFLSHSLIHRSISMYIAIFHLSVSVMALGCHKTLILTSFRHHKSPDILCIPPLSSLLDLKQLIYEKTEASDNSAGLISIINRMYFLSNTNLDSLPHKLFFLLQKENHRNIVVLQW